jgi:hypothetical protein
MGTCQSHDAVARPDEYVTLVVTAELDSGTRVMYQTRHVAGSLIPDICEGRMHEAAVGERSFGDLFDAAIGGRIVALHHVGVHIMRPDCTFHIPLETILEVVDTIYYYVDERRALPVPGTEYRRTRYTLMSVEGNLDKDTIEDIRRIMCSEEYNCIHFRRKDQPSVFRGGRVVKKPKIKTASFVYLRK